MKNKTEYSCPKCGSKDVRIRNLLLRGVMGTAGIFDGENVALYICNKCKFIEIYSRS